jgi:Putative peptidoglycan binding domain
MGWLVEIDTSDLRRAQTFAKHERGDKYLMGTQGPTTYDCSGFMAVLINVLAGKANPHKRLFGTGNEAAVLDSMGFKQGKGGAHDFTIGFSTKTELRMKYGHTAGSLGGLNVESRGGRTGGVKVGPGARSPLEAMFRHHRHLPVLAASRDRLIFKAKAFPGHNLQRNSTDHPSVKLVQEALRIGGAPLMPTGGFGPKTEHHVKLFQAHRGMPATGVVDKTTWDRLMEFLKPPNVALARIGRVGNRYDLHKLAVRFARKYFKSTTDANVNLMQRMILQLNPTLDAATKVPGGFPMKVPITKP